MAIYLFCPLCKNGSLLNSRKCRKCGTPFPREGKQYRVVVSVNKVRSTRVVENLTIAREVEIALKSQMLRDSYGIEQRKKAPTLNEVWKRYLPWAQEHKKSWEHDRFRYCKHLEKRFGHKQLDSISGFDLERLKIELSKAKTPRGTPYAPATIRHVLILLRMLYNTASRWKMYDGPSPLKDVLMPRVDNEVTEFLSDEQLSRLLDVLDGWNHDESAVIIKFAILTGIRRGEVFKLTWDSLDLDRRLVTLRDPKGKKTTTIPVSQAAADVLRSLPRTSEYCFPGMGGRERTSVKKAWYKIRQAAGLPSNFRFHGLRHHFASALVSRGIGLPVVMELLTHKNIKTTQRYAHLAPSVIRAAADQSAEILQPRKNVNRRKDAK